MGLVAQPYGTVTGLQADCHFYPRSSPFVCAADSMSLLIELIATSIHHRSVKQSFKLTISNRFGGTKDLETLLGSTWIRYLMFCLGPLPQAVRLAAFRGTPWTKAFGYMFLVSFLSIEVLCWFAYLHSEAHYSLAPVSLNQTGIPRSQIPGHVLGITACSVTILTVFFYAWRFMYVYPIVQLVNSIRAGNSMASYPGFTFLRLFCCLELSVGLQA
jgi:hypothetical protein